MTATYKRKEPDMGFASIMRAVGKYGLPAVFATYLMYTFVSDFKVAQAKTLETIEKHNVGTTMQLQHLLETEKYYQWAICNNTAVTETQRDICGRIYDPAFDASARR